MRLEEAGAACDSALTVHTRDTDPLSWAMIQTNRAGVLIRIWEMSSRPSLLDEASAACRDALTVLSPSDTPVQWAMTQANLGSVLFSQWRRSKNVATLREALLAHVSSWEAFTGLHDGRAAIAAQAVALDLSAAQKSGALVEVRKLLGEEDGRRVTAVVKSYRVE